ncbi:MAG TPA: hypothetical protein PKW90_12360 [Myxococcota bacterium]|nr:hypothetical protein [Myxococcota bacterium]
MLLLLLSSAACAPTLEELDFFEVKTLPAHPGAQLGLIALADSLSNFGPLGAEEHGFLWSDDPASLSGDAPSGSLPPRSLGKAPKDGTYRDTLLVPDPAKTYYFRAYAQRGGRRVYAPQLESFAFGLSLSIEMALLQTDNDRIALAAQVRGLTKLNTAVSDHGFVWSAVRDLPELGQDSLLTPLGLLDRDGFFRDTLRRLRPDLAYRVRAYLRAGSHVVYSAPLTLRVKDTWTKLAALPYGGGAVWGSFGVSSGSRAYVGCGCQGIPSNGVECGEAGLKDIWEFDPATQAWTKWAATPDDLQRFNATAFIMGQYLYVGGGSKHDGSAFPTNSFHKFDLNDRTGKGPIANPMPVGRSNAVSFVLGQRAYVGTGISGSGTASNQFFAFDPQAESWSAISSLPHPSGAGRHGAAAFALGGRGYVVGGFRCSTAGATDIFFSALRDCWAYDAGADAWTEMAPLPGEARADATAFVLGDTAAVLGLGYGSASGFLHDWWLFEPQKGPKGTWSKIEPRFLPARADAYAFALQGRGYVGGGRLVRATNLGYEGAVLSDGWLYWRE